MGTLKDVELGGGQQRLYVSIDGGMSDNIRTALYGADYSCLLSNRTSDVEPRVVRVVGNHCESGDIVVKDEYLPADVRRGDLISVPVTGPTATRSPPTTTARLSPPSSPSKTAR